uniref:Ig-like domain-containing protein n=1 Tax=Xenopus tropicalis TaxID=8364 RepID=F6V7F2_XENTR
YQHACFLARGWILIPLNLHCFLLWDRRIFVVVVIIPVVSFSPNWTPIFPDESVTLSCNVAPTAQGNLGYSWYRDGQRIPGDQQSLFIQAARKTDSGHYQCRAGASERSDPVTLDIKSYLLILQAPPAVHEGDFLFLRCHSQPGYDTRNTVFYMGDRIIQTPDTELAKGKVDATASGTYRWVCLCRGHCYISFGFRIYTLFTVREGDHMTITCDTKLSPHRETTELQFAFYRNGHNVQGFNSSNQYGVPSAQLEDSGNYTCEVQTPTSSVRKRSGVAYIHIQGKVCLSKACYIFLSCLKISHSHLKKGN